MMYGMTAAYGMPGAATGIPGQPGLPGQPPVMPGQAGMAMPPPMATAMTTPVSRHPSSEVYHTTFIKLVTNTKHLSTRSRLHLPSFTPMCTVISVLMTLLPTLIRICYAGPALGSFGSSLLWQPIIRLLGQSDTVILTGCFNLVGHTDKTVYRLALTPNVVLLTSSRLSPLETSCMEFLEMTPYLTAAPYMYLA